MKHGGSISTAEPQLHGIEKLKPIVKVTPSDESVAMLYLICEKLGFRSSTLPDTRASNKPAQYRLSVDYAEGLQDLISLLSAEEGKLLVKLYEMQLMERHLLPMLHVFSQRDGALTKDFTSIIALFELCLLFTKDNILASQAPPELLFDHRLRVKRLFEDEQFFSAILTLVVSSIDGMKQSRFPDQMVFELMKRSFLLVKQIVLIPDSNVLTGDFGRQSRVMRALCESKLMNFIAIASASLRHPSDGKLFSPHAANFVDILNALYSSIDPDAVALILTSVPGNSKSIESVLRDDEIRTIRKPIRHSRFSGSLSVKLATGEEYVLPASYMSKSDSSTGPQQLIKRSQSIRRKTGDGFLPIGVASNDDLRTYGHAAIQLLMSGAINELITISGNIIVVDQVTDDSLSIALMGLMTWFLRFSRTIGNQKIKKNSSSHGENNSDPFSMEFIMAALHPELVMTFSSNMRRDAYDRSKLRVLLSNIRYHREVLRAAEAIARVGYADCNTEYLLEYACKPSFAVSLRTILTGPCSARLSVKALSVAIEAIYVLIRLLRIVTDCSSLKNRNFMDFSCFIDSLACEVVVDALTRILTDSHLFNPASNRYLGSLIGKLARVNGGRFIFRISFIESLHSVIYDTNAAWKRLNQDLLNICFSVVSLFVDAVRKDPMEMIRIFFHVPSTLLKTARGLEKVISDSSLEKVEESYDLEERKDDSLDRIANWSLEEQIRWLVRQLFEDEDCSSTLSFVVSCIASFSTQNHHVFGQFLYLIMFLNFYCRNISSKSYSKTSNVYWQI